MDVPTLVWSVCNIAPDRVAALANLIVTNAGRFPALEDFSTIASSLCRSRKGG